MKRGPKIRRKKARKAMHLKTVKKQVEMERTEKPAETLKGQAEMNKIMRRKSGYGRR